MLNAEQREAVYSNHPKILCLAGAGTGKTHCMIARIARLVEDGVDPSSILALTFTNSAAFEMQSRYENLNASKQLPMFKTFHGFCYYVLSTNRLVQLKLGYNSVPDIATDPEARTMLKTAKIQSGFDKRTAESVVEQQILGKAYRRVLRLKNMITFDLLSEEVCKLFEDHDSSVMMYIRKYKYIFIDEFQDTDPVQYRFMRSFTDSNIFLVADVLQSIYTFRGADSSITKELVMSDDWSVLKLNQNYRSTYNICQYANRFSKRYADDSYRVDITSERFGYGVKEQRYKDLDKLLESVLEDYKYYGEQTAILVRTNREVEKLVNYFRSHNVAVSTNTKQHYVNYLLRSIEDETYRNTWLASLLNEQEYLTYVKNESQYNLDKFLEDFGWNRNVYNTILDIFAVQEILNSESDIVRKVDLLCKYLNLPRIRNINSKDSIQNILKSVIEMKHDTRCNLYIGTIHSVKGLEFESVYVIGVGGKTFPLTSEENQNLFYVAITRAKTRLQVYKQDFTEED